MNKKMKKVIRFSVRLVLFILAMVAIAPAFLVFAEGTTLWPNFFGLAYVGGLITLYKLAKWPKKIAEIYRVAFREFFPDL